VPWLVEFDQLARVFVFQLHKLWKETIVGVFQVGQEALTVKEDGKRLVVEKHIVVVPYNVVWGLAPSSTELQICRDFQLLDS